MTGSRLLWTMALLAGLALLAGCQQTWIPVKAAGERYASTHYSLDLPSGWMRFEKGDRLILSRDGEELGRVVIELVEHKQAFPVIDKGVSPDHLPAELAERQLAELIEADERGMPGLWVHANRPATLDGRNGFFLHLSHRRQNGLEYRTLVYGVALEAGYCTLIYTAPAIHYFFRYRKVFEELVEGFKATRT